MTVHLPCTSLLHIRSLHQCCTSEVSSSCLAVGEMQMIKDSFKRIDSSGLWSFLNTTGRPKVYLWNYSSGTSRGTSRLSISQGMTGILYLQLSFWFLVAKDMSRGNKPLNFLERFLLLLGPMPLNIFSC